MPIWGEARCLHLRPPEPERARAAARLVEIAAAVPGRTQALRNWPSVSPFGELTRDFHFTIPAPDSLLQRSGCSRASVFSAFSPAFLLDFSPHLPPRLRVSASNPRPPPHLRALRLFLPPSSSTFSPHLPPRLRVSASIPASPPASPPCSPPFSPAFLVAFSASSSASPRLRVEWPRTRPGLSGVSSLPRHRQQSIRVSAVNPRPPHRFTNFHPSIFNHLAPGRPTPHATLESGAHQLPPGGPSNGPPFFMATDKQTQANRLNAQKSTGPSSVEGKAASSQNALKSGIHAKSQIIRGEDPDDLEALIDQYLLDHHPRTAAERALIDILIDSEWLLRRLRKAEAQLWEYEFADFEKHHHQFHGSQPLPEKGLHGRAYYSTQDSFKTLETRRSSLHRTYHRALHDLRLLQSTRPIRAPQPEPQPQPRGRAPTATAAAASTPPQPQPQTPQPPPLPPKLASFPHHPSPRNQPPPVPHSPLPSRGLPRGFYKYVPLSEAALVNSWPGHGTSL